MDESIAANAVTRARYVAHGDAVRLEFASGVTVQFPRAMLPELVGADEAALKAVRPVSAGTAIAWSNLGVSVEIATLLGTIFRATGVAAALRPPRPRRPAGTPGAGAAKSGAPVKTRKRR
jgi:hypothetical protein